MTAIATTTDAPSVEQRRTALIALAEAVDLEDRFPSTAPFTPMVRDWVAPACGWPLRGNPDVAFNLFGDLVAAVADLSRFTGDECGWLSSHDLPVSDRMCELTFARLRSDVDACVDRLVVGRVA